MGILYVPDWVGRLENTILPYNNTLQSLTFSYSSVSVESLWRFSTWNVMTLPKRGLKILASHLIPFPQAYHGNFCGLERLGEARGVGRPSFWPVENSRYATHTGLGGSLFSLFHLSKSKSKLSASFLSLPHFVCDHSPSFPWFLKDRSKTELRLRIFAMLLTTKANRQLFGVFWKSSLLATVVNRKWIKLTRGKVQQGICGSCYNTDGSEIQICLSANSCPLMAFLEPSPSWKGWMLYHYTEEQERSGYFCKGKLFPGRDRSYLSKSAGER